MGARVPAQTAFLAIVFLAAVFWLVSTRGGAASAPPPASPTDVRAASISRAPAVVPRHVRRKLTHYAVRPPKAVSTLPSAHFGIVLVVRAEERYIVGRGRACVVADMCMWAQRSTVSRASRAAAEPVVEADAPGLDADSCIGAAERHATAIRARGARCAWHPEDARGGGDGTSRRRVAT